MKRLVSCVFNIDTAYVTLKFFDDSAIHIDTITVENEITDDMYQQSKMDWLIYNKPLKYA